jgi:hypothetical protein
MTIDAMVKFPPVLMAAVRDCNLENNFVLLHFMFPQSGSDKARRHLHQPKMKG